MKFNKWWGLLVGLIISIIAGFLMGGYTEGDNLVVKNSVGLGIIAVGFIIGWWWESQNKGKDK
jgi:high-affinity Fe2+/Pb2+ permease